MEMKELNFTIKVAGGGRTLVRKLSAENLSKSRSEKACSIFM